MAADAPNVTDWLQGIGTVAAFALTGVGLLWEARSRRIERVERDLAAARGLVVEAIPYVQVPPAAYLPRSAAARLPPTTSNESTTADGARIVAKNWTTEPALSVYVVLIELTPGSARKLGDSDVFNLGPGETWEGDMHFDKPVDVVEVRNGYRVGSPDVLYTMAGRRWWRIGTDEPQVFTGDAWRLVYDPQLPPDFRKPLRRFLARRRASK